MSSSTNTEFELTGILATSDSFGRLRLCFVDFLESTQKRDSSWYLLKKNIPDTEQYSVPYTFPLGGRADDAGIRGECWITLPRVKQRRRSILAFAKTLRGKEVRLTVKPKRFSFDSNAPHNFDAQVAGTSLLFVGGLESLLESQSE